MILSGFVVMSIDEATESPQALVANTSAHVHLPGVIVMSRLFVANVQSTIASISPVALVLELDELDEIALYASLKGRKHGPDLEAAFRNNGTNSGRRSRRT